MSDAEQAKGQVAEARRIAKKYGLSNITVVIDYNDAQISGRARDIMHVNIKENYLSDGWRVIEVDGHDIEQLLHALKEAVEDKVNPVAILAHTVMGKGVSFIENNVSYHGKPLTRGRTRKGARGARHRERR
jgi:transketolase